MGRCASGENVTVGHGPLAHLVCLLPRGRRACAAGPRDLVGGFGVVVVRVVVQELAEAQRGAHDDDHGQLRIAHAEPAGMDGRFDVATNPGASPRFELGRARP
jgi:hypothetical protein